MSASSTMRILMTADAVGGVWTFASGLAETFASSGAKVHLVTMGPAPRADQRGMLTSSKVRLIETDLALEWQDPQGDDVCRARRRLAEIERRIAPDIIHLNSFREGAFDWKAPIVVTAHSCVHSWGRACNDTAWLGQRKWRHYSYATAAGLDRANAWVSPTRAFRDVMAELYRPASPGRVIWNGLVSAAPTGARKEELVLAAGRMWDGAKNLAALADASLGLDWPVFVAGPPGASVETAVHLLGNLSYRELQSWMHRAAIFVSPARYEPFGLSVLEAAAAGCALLLSDIPTFRELWDGAALFCDPTDHQALHDALAGLCSDGEKRAELQRAARARSRDFPLARTAKAYADLYRSLAERPRRPATPAAHEVPA
jgi:glycosyltransferase involved in cell wall biosynthesis